MLLKCIFNSEKELILVPFFIYGTIMVLSIKETKIWDIFDLKIVSLKNVIIDYLVIYPVIT